MDSDTKQFLKTRQADPHCRGCWALEQVQAVEELHRTEQWLREEIDRLEGCLRARDQEIGRLQEETDRLKAHIRKMLKKHKAEKRNKGVPSWVKPNRRKGAKKRPGAKPGHPGLTRSSPKQIDEVVDVHTSRCPDCGGRTLKPLRESSEHTQEDFQPGRPRVRLFRRQVYWCRRCCKRVYPSHAEEIPGSYLGPEVIAQAASLKYQSRLPFRSIREVLKTSYGIEVSASGLSQALGRLADRLLPAYDGLLELVRVSDVVHADETSWRQDGRQGWLWSFSNRDVSVARIEPTRSKDVVREVLGLKLSGVLVSDFYGAYHSIEAPKQRCLIHVKRDLREARQKAPRSQPLKRFQRAFERWLGSAIELKAVKGRLSKAAFQARRSGLERRLSRLARMRLPPESPAAALPGRLAKHRQELLTFLDYEGVDYHNNHAERQIRPHAVIRKISYGTRSAMGSITYQVLMSVLGTCKLQGTDFRMVCRQALLNPRASAYHQLTWIFGKLPTQTFVKALRRLAKEGPFERWLRLHPEPKGFCRPAAAAS